MKNSNICERETEYHVSVRVKEPLESFFSGRISDLCSRSRHPRDKNSAFQLFFFQIPSLIRIARIIFNFPPHFETLLAMGRGQTEHGKVPFQELSLSLSRSECDKRTAVGDKTSAERQTIASLAFSGCRAGRSLGYVFQGREEVDKFVIGIIMKGLN